MATRKVFDAWSSGAARGSAQLIHWSSERERAHKEEGRRGAARISRRSNGCDGACRGNRLLSCIFGLLFIFFPKSKQLTFSLSSRVCHNNSRKKRKSPFATERQPRNPDRSGRPLAAMAVSNNITACLNFLALVCAIPVVVTGIWFASKQGEDCARLARWPVAILGGLLLLVALAGFVGAYWNRQGLLAAYLFAMAVLITLLLALLVFAFAVTRGSGAYPVPGRAYDDYRLDGFSMWLRGYVTDDPGRWEGIRACLAASDTCRKLAQESTIITPEQFYQSQLSPLQSGCCKPPTACGYAYVSPTVWTNPANPAADADCGAWSNDPSQLCYNCGSCKAGMLGTLRDQWRKANVALVVATVALIFVYVIGCSAFKNAQTEDLFRRYKWGNV